MVSRIPYNIYTNFDIINDLGNTIINKIEHIQEKIIKASLISPEINYHTPFDPTIEKKNTSCQKQSQVNENMITLSNPRSKDSHEDIINNSLKEKEDCIKYLFRVIRSKKRQVGRRINKIISRVHNNDCMLKKIKAKYLKYIINELQHLCRKLPISFKKFEQEEVRTIDPSYNIKSFINLKISTLLLRNKIINEADLNMLIKAEIPLLKEMLNKIVKNHYLFNFLSSNEFGEFIKDPMKIYQKLEPETKKQFMKKNRNCMKFKKYSKNLFFKNINNYEKYKKLLLITSSNFIFLLQNNYNEAYILKSTKK